MWRALMSPILTVMSINLSMINPKRQFVSSKTAVCLPRQAEQLTWKPMANQDPMAVATDQTINIANPPTLQSRYGEVGLISLLTTKAPSSMTAAAMTARAAIHQRIQIHHDSKSHMKFLAQHQAQHLSAQI